MGITDFEDMKVSCVQSFPVEHCDDAMTDQPPFLLILFLPMVSSSSQPPRFTVIASSLSFDPYKDPKNCQSPVAFQLADSLPDFQALLPHTLYTEVAFHF